VKVLRKGRRKSEKEKEEEEKKEGENPAIGDL
jgi:hypothetical protein